MNGSAFARLWHNGRGDLTDEGLGNDKEVKGREQERVTALDKFRCDTK